MEASQGPCSLSFRGCLLAFNTRFVGKMRIFNSFSIDYHRSVTLRASQSCRMLLSPGEYSGRRNRNLRISLGAAQELRIVAAGAASGGAVLDGGGHRFLLNVTGARPARVLLEGLVLRNAGTAVAVRGGATAEAMLCRFEACVAGAVRANDTSRHPALLPPCPAQFAVAVAGKFSSRQPACRTLASGPKRGGNGF
jgi:hypothetical protein